MSEEKKHPKRWLVPFPEKKAQTGHPCQDACNGNAKMGQLLHYFLCEASWELERQELEESCKVVKFTRSHAHILKKVNISEKSLIQFLKQFNAWEFVLSESYSKVFTVQADPIRDAMYNPVITKKVRAKSCTSTSAKSTTSQEVEADEKSCKVVTLQENPEVLKALQLYSKSLEDRLEAALEALKVESCKVYNLGQKAEALQDYNIALSTWVEAVSEALKIPSPIDSRDRDIIDSKREYIAVASANGHAPTLSSAVLQQVNLPPTPSEPENENHSQQSQLTSTTPQPSSSQQSDQTDDNKKEEGQNGHNAIHLHGGATPSGSDVLSTPVELPTPVNQQTAQSSLAATPGDSATIEQLQQQEVTPQVELPAQQQEQASEGAEGATRNTARGRRTRKEVPAVEQSSLLDVPKGPPLMPSETAKWCAETAVQIVEAKKGRRYGEATRKQEIARARDALKYTINEQPITREQFEYAWDNMCGWKTWAESKTPPMIKHLLKDDRIVDLAKPQLYVVKSPPSQPPPAAASTLLPPLINRNREERRQELRKGIS